MKGRRLGVKAVRCIYCGNNVSDITNYVNEQRYVRRIRKCRKCGKYYTTYEFTVVKPNRSFHIALKQFGREQQFLLWMIDNIFEHLELQKFREFDNAWKIRNELKTLGMDYLDVEPDAAIKLKETKDRKEEEEEKK